MTSRAATVAEYLESLTEDRRDAIEAVRKVILASVPKGIVEGMQYGAIGYFVPHELYPAGYHCDPKQPLPFAGLASQKGHMAVYLFCTYVSPATVEAFVIAYKATGKKLDMGASCVRFKKLEHLPLDVIASTLSGITLEGFIAAYEAAKPAPKSKK